MAVSRPFLSVTPPYAAFALLLALAASAEPFTLGSLNGGAEFDSRAEHVARVLGRHGDVDAWAIGDVQTSWEQALVTAAGRGGRQYSSACSSGPKRHGAVCLLHDPSRFDVLSDPEPLRELQSGGSVPVAGRFRDPESGVEFWLMAVGMSFRDEQTRWEEAGRIRAWVNDQTLPVVIAGATNTADRLNGRYRDPAIEILTDGQLVARVKPVVLKRQRCNPNAQASVLDSVYVGLQAQEWDVESALPDEWGTYCPEHSPPCCFEPPRCGRCGPPHLPVLTTLAPRLGRRPQPERAWQPRVEPSGDYERPAAGAEQPSREELLEALREIQSQLDALKEIVEEDSKQE